MRMELRHPPMEVHAQTKNPGNRTKPIDHFPDVVQVPFPDTEWGVVCQLISLRYARTQYDRPDTWGRGSPTHDYVPWLG